MARPRVDPTQVKAIAQRLLSLREALGYTQKFMGELIGVSGNAWQNWEAGVKRINVDAAVRLCKKANVTLDWIYLGDEQVLRPDLVHKLHARQNCET
jgi:transcriptional regulator with XRE-family HTH domain